jgi:phage gp46-like protein
LREHPEWPIGAAVVVVLLKPRRALRWGMRLWWGWRTARRALEWVDRRR